MIPSKRKKIVVLIDWYLPGYKAGGPIQSVASIVARLKDEFDFAIITSDTDASETTPLAGIKSDEWNITADGTRVYYFSKEKRSYNTLKKLMLAEQADAFYLNSLFSVFFTIYPLLIRKNYMPNRKTVLAPRGMLGKGALHIKSLKKKMFLLLARIAGIYKNITWHASTSQEEKEVKDKFGRNARIKIATNLTAPKASPNFQRVKENGSARFFFLSRISSKKNLLYTIQSLSKLPSNYKVAFHIYGPVDDPPYWEECQHAIQQVKPHISIIYKGPIANTATDAMMANYHFSLLQTQHENFGHSIIESMAAGCPVIISDQTPWRNLETVKAGWDIPLKDESALLKALEDCCKMDLHTFNECSKAAFDYASKVINNPELVEDNKMLFA